MLVDSRDLLTPLLKPGRAVIKTNRGRRGRDTPLHNEKFKGNIYIAQFLIFRGASANKPDS